MLSFHQAPVHHTYQSIPPRVVYHHQHTCNNIHICDSGTQKLGTINNNNVNVDAGRGTVVTGTINRLSSSAPISVLCEQSSPSLNAQSKKRKIILGGV